MSHPDYIKAIICEAYRNTETREVIFITYYVLEYQAWFDYRNREDKATPTDHYYDASTKKFTLILNERMANTYGVSYDEVGLLLSNNIAPVNFRRMTNVGERAGYNNVKFGYEHAVDTDYWYNDEQE